MMHIRQLLDGAIRNLKPLPGEHMRKVIYIVSCLVLFSSSARAQEKTLHGVSEIILSHAEGTVSCIAAGKECSEAEVLGLKTDAENDVRDVVLLIKSGNVNRMKLTHDQAMALNARLAALQSQFVHIKIFDAVCNFGIYYLNFAQYLMLLGMSFFAVGGILLTLLGLIMLPAAGLVMLSCLFWWL